MKAFILVALLTVSFALNDNGLKQGKIFENNDELQNTKLGRVILKLAEFGSMSQQFDFNRLFLAIEELEQSIRDASAEENTLFNQDKESYVADLQFYQNQVTQYTTEGAQHEQDLQSLDEQLTYLQQYLSEKIEQLSQSNELREQLEALMTSLQATYQQQISDYDEAIDVLDQAVVLLGQLNDAPEFIETNSQSLAQIAQKLKSRFDIFPHQRIFYQPLTQALLQMTTDKFADQDLTRKVIQLLESLRKSLAQGKLTLQNNFESQRQGNQQILDQYDELIESLEDVVIPQLKDDIKTTDADISTKQGLLRDAIANLQAAQDNEQFTEYRFLKRSTQHQELLGQYNTDLATIGSALSTLERNGIRKQ